MENLRDKIAIVGIGETEYVRRSSRGAKALIVEAVQKALDDAQIKPEEVDGIVTEGREIPKLFPHIELSHNLGMRCRFDATIAKWATGNIASTLIAAMAISSGQADVVLGYYSNNFGTQPGIIRGDEGLPTVRASCELPYGCSAPAIQFAMFTRRYMHEYGLTTRQLASIAVNQRRNALLNGKGMMKKPLSYEDYENSPMISDPLRREDCCLMNDGSCAWVMTSAERAKSCPNKPVYVMGVGFDSVPKITADSLTQEYYLRQPYDGLAMERALKMAGITRDDLDFAQIYDAFTIMVVLFLERLGFCKEGEGGAFAESGITSLEGALPVNTHGGQLSHSYINKANDLLEAVRQLRGEAGACQVKDAKIGMVHGGTGSGDAAVVILRKD